MKLKIVVSLFLTIVIVGCKQKADKIEGATKPEIEIAPSQKISSNTTDWVTAINAHNLPNIEKMYAPDAIKVITADSILDSSKKIAAHYGTQKTKITSIESVFNVEANKDRQINYELIGYKTEGLKEYMQLLIWRLEDQKVIREFEFTTVSSPGSEQVDRNDIAERRKLWIELCNMNNAEKLVRQVYSTNTIYFNHKPLVRGVEDVIEEYDYMNDSNYNLNLEPLKLEVVNASLAIEIGQCSGSYNGKYILVWKKESDGTWKIHMDSNI